jgi:hypothetical protein
MESPSAQLQRRMTTDGAIISERSEPGTVKAASCSPPPTRAKYHIFNSPDTQVSPGQPVGAVRARKSDGTYVWLTPAAVKTNVLAPTRLIPVPMVASTPTRPASQFNTGIRVVR